MTCHDMSRHVVMYASSYVYAYGVRMYVIYLLVMTNNVVGRFVVVMFCAARASRIF